MTDSQDSNTDARCADCDASSADDRGVCPTKRRRILAGLAAGGSAALAGCTGLLGAPREHQIRGGDEVYDVSFAEQETTIEIRGSQTVLRAAEEQALSLPSDCRAGFCGVCLSRADDDATSAVHMATNNYDRLTEAAVEAGYFLPCTSQPRSNFSVTTGISPDELDEFVPDDPDNGEEPNDEPGDVGRRHAIRYVNEGWIIPVGEQQNLLTAAEDVGLDELPYQCRVGRCGVCLSRIDGDATELVEHESIGYGPLDEDALREGYVLTCTAQPRGEFELESNRAGDL